MTPLRRPRDRSGYTLTELMVVILIIMIVAAMALPALLPAVANRRLGDAARMLHAELQAAQDRAVRYNTPQGVRLVPDPYDSTRPDVVTASKLIAIEPAPDYSEGQVLWWFDTGSYPPPGTTNPPPYGTVTVPNYPYLVVHEDKFTYPVPSVSIPDPPTMWYFNVRQGDKIVISGNTYTVAGPIANPANSPTNVTGFNNWNPERFVNFGASYFSNPSNGYYEFLYLMDGIDNDGDGVIDEGFDGIDNDGDGIIDPGFNGLDDNGNGLVDEWQEAYYSLSAPTPYYGCPGTSGYAAQLAAACSTPSTPFPNEYEAEGRSFKIGATGPPFYTYSSGITNPGGSLGIDYLIHRRPVPSRASRIVNLPANVVIDMTTWNLTRERSRLPLDPYSGNVDVMFAPDGHVLNLGATANPAPQLMPFYHYWLADVEDVHEPKSTSGTYPLLPVDAEEIYNSSLTMLEKQAYGDLQGERKLLTINTKTGNIVTNAIEAFDLADPNYVYEAAQAGSDQKP